MRFAARLWRATYLRYVGASAVSLAIDMIIFVALTEGGIWPSAASALGYCAGVAAHWMISSRAIFARSVRTLPIARAGQKVSFAMSAVIGLILTTLIVGLADMIGSNPLFGKFIAIGVSFQVTYLIRSKVVFT